VSAITVALLVVLAIGVAVGVYALAAPRRRRETMRGDGKRESLRFEAAWNDGTAAEFARLPEPERCEMIFAVASLEDERSARLLEYALGDPSEAVALAAARGLSERGLASTVDAYLENHPGKRADSIARTLALLAPER